MLQLATAPARFLLDELGQGAWKAVGTFRPLVARYGLKNVPTPIEIMAGATGLEPATSGVTGRQFYNDFNVSWKVF